MRSASIESPFGTTPNQRCRQVKNPAGKGFKKNKDSLTSSDKKVREEVVVSKKAGKNEDKTQGFGYHFARLRRERGLTQQELEDKTGFDKRMISRWESGVNKPGIEAAATLANVLGVSLDELAGLKGASGAPGDELAQLAGQLNQEQVKDLVALIKP